MQLSHPSRLTVAAALLVAIALPVPAAGQSSPAPCAPPTVVDATAVAIPGGTSASDGQQPGPMPTTAPSVCWTAAIGNPVLGAAIAGVADLVLSSTDTGALVALGPDGVERWRYQAGDTPREVRALAVTPDTAVITTSTGLVALAVADGMVRWQYEVPASSGYAAQVPDAIGAFWLAQAGSTLVATTASFPDGEQQVQALVAVDVTTGSQLWQAPLPAEGSAGTPATDGTTVVVTAGDGTIEAFDLASGEARWSVATDAIGSTVATNLAFSSGMVLAGLADATVVALRASDGTTSWHSAALDPSGAAPIGIAATMSGAYVDTGTMLVAIDPVTGATPWGVTLQQAPPMFPVPAIPAIVGETIVVGTSDAMDVANLVAVSAAGAELWRAPTEIYGGILSPMVIDGRIYAAAYGLMDGGLLAFGTP